MIRNYYISQRIQYNWFGSYAFCKLNGMKLAKMADNTELLDEFVTIANRKIPASFYIDTYLENQTLTSCYKFSKRSNKYFKRFTINSSECKTHKADFLCEELEMEKILIESETQEESLAKTKFFNFVGDYRKLKNLSLFNFLHLI